MIYKTKTEPSLKQGWLFVFREYENELLNT
jgi:hypothetical protein